MDEDSDDASTDRLSVVWKEPVNGHDVFFTEEVYERLAGPSPSLEQRVAQLMDALGYPPGPPSHYPPPPPPSSSKSHDSQNSTHELKNCSLPGTSASSPESHSSASSSTATQGHSTTSTVFEVKNLSDASSSSLQEEEGIEEDGLKNSVDETKEENDSLVITDAPASSETPICPPSSQNNVEPGLPQTESKPSVAGEGGSSVTVLASPSSSASGTGIESNPKASEAGSEANNGVKGDSSSESLKSTGSEADPTASEGGSEVKRNVAEGASGLSSMETKTKKDNKGAGGTAATALQQPEPPRFSGRRAKGSDKGKSRVSMLEPPKSSLNHAQHLRYLHLFQKCTQRFFSGFCQPPTDSEMRELKEFEALQLLVAKEQGECQSYLKQVAESSPHLYTNLDPQAAVYMKEKEQRGWKRAESYCRYYNTDGQLPLMLDISHPSHPLPLLTLKQTLLEMGSKCKVVLPDLNPNPNARFKRTVNMDLAKVKARFPPVTHNNQRVWNHEPASKDLNLEGLVRKYPCEVATSASVLQQLMDNQGPEFGSVWDIPVVVRDYGHGAASRRVVFLDKPLRPKVISLSDQKSLYLTKAARAYLCLPHNERKASAGLKGRPVTKETTATAQSQGEASESDARSASVKTEADDDDPFGSVSMEDLETFGSDKMLGSDNRNRKVVDLKKDETKQSRDAQGRGESRGASSQHVDKSTVPDEVGESKDPVPSSKSKDAEETLNGSDAANKSSLEGKDLSMVKTQEREMTPSSSGGSHNTASAEVNNAGTVERAVDSHDDDTDSDALIAVDSCSPSKVCHPHGMRRRSHSIRTSGISDEVPPSPSSSPSSIPPASESASPSSASKRITRSTSQRLLSPEIDAESSMGVDVSSSPRTRRRSLKQQVLESGAQVEGSNGEIAGDAKKCRKTMTAGQLEDTTTGAGRVIPAAAEEVKDDGKGEEKTGTEKEGGGSTTIAKPAQSGSKQGAEAGPSYLDSLLNEMTPQGRQTTVRMQEDPSQYLQPAVAGEHVSYHQWDLGGTSVIVRCNNHAFVTDMRQQQRTVYVRSKPERQMPYGLEQNTLSECVRGWMGCYLRPNSYLLKARVNTQNHEVLHTEEFQLNQILQPALNFSPQHAFAVLKNVFAKLTQLQAGSYLLTHEAGASHILLKSGTAGKRGSYDMRSHYMGLVMQEPDSGVRFIPVDPTMMLHHHWRMGLIPACFHPPDFDKNRKRQQQHQQYMGPKKKRKKKQ